MVVIQKKRILFLFTCILIGIFVCALQQRNVETMQTVSLPCTNKIVILDAGHGLPDEGAESIAGTTEADINLKITLKVQNLLEQSGCIIFLTRSDENGIYDIDKTTLREKKVSDIKNRVKIGNESSGDIFVSIHLNKIPQEQYWAWQTFYKKTNENSEKLAKCLQNGLNETIKRENKRESLPISNIYIVDHVEIPISIVECGFLSNPEEEKLLLTEEYQDKLAWGIYTGIMDYFAMN